MDTLRYTFDHVRFGKDLRHWRENEELTTLAVADLFGVRVGIVVSWEKGWSQGMSISTLIYACEWMDKDPRQYVIHVTDDIPY